MHEFIIKVIGKTKEEIDEMSIRYAQVTHRYDGKLKACAKDEATEEKEAYSNEIWQVGEKESNPDNWRIKIEK
jgi:hypothetical protein